MFRLVLQSHISESKFHIIQLIESGSFRKEIHRTNLPCQRRILILQKKNHLIDGFNIFFAKRKNPLRIFGRILNINFFLKYLLNAIFVKQFQNHFDTQIHLIRRNIFGIQKTFDVRRRRIRRVELRERWRDEQKIFQKKIFAKISFLKFEILVFKSFKGSVFVKENNSFHILLFRIVFLTQIF